MPWIQCAIAFPGDFEGIEDPFEEIFARHGRPANMALFCRNTDDFRLTIFLLSPTAAKFSNSLRGHWTPAKDLTSFGWSLLVGSGTPHDYFRLPSPSAVRRFP